MKIGLIIWDLDGVLVDSLGRSIENFTEIIKEYSREKVSKKEIYNKYLGATEEQDVIKLAISKRIDSSKLDLVQSEFIRLKQENLRKIKMFKKIDKIILFAKEKGIKQILITGRDLYSAKKILDNDYTKINDKPLTDYFDYFMGGDEYPGKLNAFELMGKKYNINPSKILVLGDEIKDIEFARKLGYLEGACLWGSFVKGELKKLKPTNIFKTPAELFKYLQN